MWFVVCCYILIFLVVTGCLIATARSERAARAAQQDADEITVIPEEWEVTRREHCLPTACPRLLGDGPRKDDVCRRCAAEFLEHRWNLLLGQTRTRR
jgi:hypothetical protein